MSVLWSAHLYSPAVWEENHILCLSVFILIVLKNIYMVIHLCVLHVYTRIHIKSFCSMKFAVWTPSVCVWEQVCCMIEVGCSISPLGVPSEVDSYHSLFPLEPLPPPNRLQKTSNFSYITSCYKAVNSKDDLPYCLRRIHGEALGVCTAIPVVILHACFSHIFSYHSSVNCECLVLTNQTT